MLVEDNLPDATFVQELLPTDLYSITTATSLAAAQKTSKLSNFDIVLLDLSLPDSSGLQTFISISEELPNIPIVVLTGLKDDAVAARAIKYGAQDFVHKSALNEEALRRIIRYSIERSHAEGMLRESANKAKAAEQYLKLALRASYTGVWSWQILTNQVSVDDQMLAMFGLAPEAKVLTVTDLLNSVCIEDRERIKSALQTATELGQGYDIDFRVIWKDGSEHYIAATGNNIFDDAGKSIVMAGVCRDITKNKAEQKNAKRLVILEKHEDFIATLTHDLKNPLLGADRLLDLFLTGAVGELQPEQVKLLDLLRNSNAEMLALIKDLLEVYRYDEGIMPLNYADVDICATAHACMLQLQAVAERSGITCAENFPEEDHTIKADSIALGRVIRNLLSNAMKFTKPGGSITISGRMSSDFYTLTVEDTGTGISPDDFERLFQRFSPGKQSKQNTAGTGLGLYLCRQLVEAHGGKIVCTNSSGVGTVFTIVLPVN